MSLTSITNSQFNPNKVSLTSITTSQSKSFESTRSSYTAENKNKRKIKKYDNPCIKLLCC